MSGPDRKAARAALRQRLRETRRAMRVASRERLAQSQQRQAEAAEQIREKRRKHRSKSKKRWRPSRLWWVVLALLVLLLFLRPCRCTPEPEPGSVGGPIVPVAHDTDIVAVNEPPAPLPRTPRRPRPGLPAPDPGPPSWIDAFRLQVASRAPRLAECLEGSEAPGRFKWTTSVDPADGTVSEHTLEPVLLSGDLSTDERTCVLRVLSNPPYQLHTGTEPSTPSRVGLVVEF